MTTDTTKFASMLELDDADMAITEWDDNSGPTTPTHNESLAAATRYAVNNGQASLSAAFASLPELSGHVEKVPLYTPTGALMPRAYGTVRTMPDGQIQALGTVGERYRVVQDTEALNILEPIADQFPTWNVGCIGAKTWIYGQNDSFKRDIVPGDTIEARVLVGNSHDGSIPWSIGFPGNRVVCQNTFHYALSSKLSKLLKVRHTAQVTDIISQVKAAVEAFGYEFIEAADKLQSLARVKVSEAGLKEYTGFVFSKWADEDESESTVEGSRVYARVLENFESGRGSEYSRGTAWGAYNAVTEYLSHQRHRESTPDGARFADLAWGQGATLARRALEGAYQLA